MSGGGFKSEDPINEPANQRRVVRPQSSPARKSKGPVGFIVFLLLIGGAVAGLHFTGNLQPLIDKIKAAISKTEATPEKTDNTVADEASKAEPVKREPVVVDADFAEPSDEEIEQIIKARDNEDPNSIEAQYRARFRPPPKGSQVMINQDRDLSGRLVNITPEGVWLNNGKAEYMVPVSVMNAYSLARFYEDSYVAFMSYAQRQMEANAKSMAARSERMQTAYAKYESGGKSGTSAKTTSKSSTPKKAALKEGDLRRWMDENGASDMLRARQARIREYEKQRAKEGRDY